MGTLASANPAGTPLPGFLNVAVGPLDHYGVWAIALLILLENIGVPVIPGEAALIAGAIFAGTGRAGLNVVEVGVVAVAAAVVGAEIGYLIGRLAGRELVLHYGKYVLITPHHLDRAEAIVSRFGGVIVIIARYIVGLREANGVIGGITQMRWLTFAFFNVFGACAWVATWLTIGYVAGDHIDAVYGDVNRFALYVLLALAVLLAGYIVRRVVRRRRASHVTRQGPAAEESPATEENSEAEEGAVAEENSASGKGSASEEASASGESSAPEQSSVAGGNSATREDPETAENPGTVESPVSRARDSASQEPAVTTEVAEANGHPPTQEPSDRGIRD
jgi:membrane protein DedA with SNARE-associated domain